MEVTLANTPGSLDQVAEKLGEAGVNIRYSYPGSAGSTGTVYLTAVAPIDSRPQAEPKAIGETNSAR